MRATQAHVANDRTEAPWSWPLNLDQYDRSPELSGTEKVALDRRARFPERLGNWTPLFRKELGRLAQPILDAENFLQCAAPARPRIQSVIVRGMHHFQLTYWGWDTEQWRSVLEKPCSGSSSLLHCPRNARALMLAVAYLLRRDHEPLVEGRRFQRLSLAYRIFGYDSVDAALERIKEPLVRWGYIPTRVTVGIRTALCDLLLLNKSPRLEDITYELVERLRDPMARPGTAGVIFRLSKALAGLGIIDRPLGMWGDGNQGVPARPTDAIAPRWALCAQRWRDATTLSPAARKSYYRQILIIGRWVNAERPEVASPEDWTRETAAECVAMICRKNVGEWVDEGMFRCKAHRGKPLSASTRLHFLNVISTFFRDCQDWELIPRRFDASRAFAQPRQLRGLLGTNPQVISDHVWAKLLWAGLNLTEDDLSNVFGGCHYYPLTMIRAVTVVWLFAGLRRSEIRRLRVGCIRYAPAPNAPVDRQNQICLLDVPVNKTSTAFTKPVDPAVGEAIRTWEADRPVQPLALDDKTGELVHFLFHYRTTRFSLKYLNKTLIPALCKKAGIPREDARGRITSHRARSTIATQLFNAKQPLSLFELQAWLGHSSPHSTQHYARISPTKLARSYTDAAYFQRNLRTIEVLIDQEVVRSGKADSEPWRFYDLGHGYCTYDFFDQCPHRMACARCGFYRPKNSAAALFLEGRKNLLRLQQDIPLTEAEANAVEDGVNAFEKLLAQLTDVPTPVGPTPRQLQSGLVQIDSNNERGHDASGTG